MAGEYRGRIENTTGEGGMGGNAIDVSRATVSQWVWACPADDGLCSTLVRGKPTYQNAETGSNTYVVCTRYYTMLEMLCELESKHHMISHGQLWAETSVVCGKLGFYSQCIRKKRRTTQRYFSQSDSLPMGRETCNYSRCITLV